MALPDEKTQIANEEKLIDQLLDLLDDIDEDGPLAMDARRAVRALFYVGAYVGTSVDASETDLKEDFETALQDARADVDEPSLEDG